MKKIASLLFTLAFSASASAQTSAPDAAGIVALWQKVRTISNVVYERANGWEGKLDVYAIRGQAPSPVVIYIHGGGWVQGTKEGSALATMPFIQMGYSVVNVEYRLANVSLAPAAIEDCRCALRWVIAHGKEMQYNFDTSRIVIAGASAGGHLAMTTGMLPASAGFDRMCYTMDEPKVSAIVNFFGIADLPDMLEG